MKNRLPQPLEGTTPDPGPGGDLAARMRALDWTRTDLGPPASWPRSLYSYVSMILEMPTPAIIFWGPDQTQLYNDGYAVIMGPRHPRYLAAPYRECWPDTFPVIHPWMRKVLEHGETIRVTDQLFTLTRHGFQEEAYFTFTFSPLRDDEGNIAGIFQPVVEVTDAVIARRRTGTLRELAVGMDAPRPVVGSAAAALSAESKDIPFSLLYLRDGEAETPGLAASSGFEGADANPPRSEALSRAVRRALEEGSSHHVEDAGALLGRTHVGVWEEPTRAAYVLPVQRSPSDPCRGVAVFGISPRLRFDARYREFLEAVGRQIAANLAAEGAKETETDLLAREQAARREAELQKEHLASLLEQAPTPMVVLRGQELVIELANPVACQVWQREHAQVIDRPILEALPELRGQGFDDLLLGVLRTGEPHVGRETLARLQKPDGSTTEVYFTFVYSPLRTSQGEVAGVLVLAFDVTEQVRAREQVDSLRSAAEEANRAKDEFFAMLGHELRNPLAPILTALQVMRLRGAREVAKERNVIERQAQHLVRLVDDLLDVSRITRGKIDLKKERVRIADVIAHAVEMASPLLERHRHILEVGDAGALAVDGDAERLAQAVANLLTNAAKYSEPGGTINVAARDRDGEVEVTVRDTGIGIDPEILPRVFEAFVQARQALDRSQGGLGLGLAIVRGIVELHGGSVQGRSEGRGRGAEFVIRMPAAPALPAPGAEASPEVARPARRGEGLSILIVDDNRDAAELLAEFLSDSGHRVAVAHDGPAALRLAATMRPAVALLDIGLPVMNGYEVARRLRTMPELDGIRLVAVTGYGRDSDRARSSEAGFDAHLVKPIDVTRLEAILATDPTGLAADGGSRT